LSKENILICDFGFVLLVRMTLFWFGSYVLIILSIKLLTICINFFAFLKLDHVNQQCTGEMERPIDVTNKSNKIKTTNEKSL